MLVIFKLKFKTNEMICERDSPRRERKHSSSNKYTNCNLYFFLFEIINYIFYNINKFVYFISSFIVHLQPNLLSKNLFLELNTIEKFS